MTYDLITIAREYGAGGSELGRALAERLGWPVLDQDLPRRVAERLRLEPAVVEAMDEHPPSLLARFTSAMLVCPPESPLFVDTSVVLSPDVVADAVRAEVLAAAGAPAIVVGHGGMCILRDRPHTLHVRLVAPIADRIRRISAREALDPRTAPAALRKMDDDRNAYIRRYHQTDWRDPLHYDLIVNTGRLAIAELARTIAELVGQTAAEEAPTVGA
jgi:cytidylate kinase